MPKSEDRAAEFTRLLVEQGTATRSMKYGWKPDDGDAKATIKERAARLVELAELLGHDDPEKYVNERIAAWLKLNPLALTRRRVKAVIEDSASNVDGQVSIQIGDPTSGGYYYLAKADDLHDDRGVLHFVVPESVAEHFRQQGYRKRSREVAAVLGFTLPY